MIERRFCTPPGPSRPTRCGGPGTLNLRGRRWFRGFSAVNGIVNFTFARYAVARNLNYVLFSHYSSTLWLVYAGNQMGLHVHPRRPD
ncbi:hypothetical protein COCNU_10G000080 [Cocos nucifera]|uniref:Uncharacterized protein n=1 Tax=Cocos nucifera TaxID=13894 RepID=A0A8K0ILF2_COCNU|nr:hypothetical protein COCNU_10G000080 [Cocos nucifera]